MMVRAALGAILIWLPVSPEVIPELSGYLCPIYVGATFASVFYFRREIGLMPQDFIARRASDWSRVFLYSILFTFAIGYPLARKVGFNEWELVLIDFALGVLLLLLGVVNRALLKLPEDIKTFVLSILIGGAQGLSSPGISRGSSTLSAAILVEKDIEKAVKASLLASSGYFALRAIILEKPPWNSVGVLMVSSVSFLLSLVMLELLLRFSRYGRKFVIIYAFLSLILLIWR
jgi:undecaprenyl-diphosphatase